MQVKVKVSIPYAQFILHYLIHHNSKVSLVLFFQCAAVISGDMRSLPEVILVLGLTWGNMEREDL